MKKQIMMTAISLCSLTWAMDHKAEQPYYAKATKGKPLQPDLIQPLFKPTPSQSMEREQEANILLPKLPGYTTSNTTSLNKSNLFIVHRDRAKL
jgi:hypothetical protein